MGGAIPGKNVRRSFVTYCTETGRLTRNQFDDMVENHLKWSESGLKSEFFSDWNPSEPAFYVTSPRDYTPDAARLATSSLRFFAARYLREHGYATSRLDEYVTFRTVVSEY